MSLAQQVEKQFSRSTRERGEGYVNAGAVHLVNSEETWASFEVEGSEIRPYAVLLDWEEGLQEGMECNCPHFAKGNNCKHLWASILVADREGLVRERSSTPRRPPQSQTSRTGGKPSWQKQLGQLPVDSRLNSSFAASHALNWRPRELIYCLEHRIESPSPIISVFQREREDDGSWGTPFAFDDDDPAFSEVTDATDRRILGLLAGNQDLNKPTYLLNQWEQDRVNPIEVVLHPELYDLLFPILADTNRFVYLPKFDFWQDMRPIRWNAEEPWSFELSAESLASENAWALRGMLKRGSQVQNLAKCLSYYPTGLILLEDQLARFHCPDDSRWIDLFREQETLQVPFEDKAALIREMWQSGNALKVTGEEQLNVTGTLGTPRGKLVVIAAAADSYQPYGNRPGRTLYAKVSFRYDQHEVSLNSATRTWFDEASSHVICTNQEEEAQLFNRLRELGLRRKQVNRYGTTAPGHLEFAASELDRIVATLVEEDWEVHTQGLPVRKGGQLSLSVRSGVDWFELNGEVDFNGEAVPLPDLLAALRSGERYIRLGDGSQGMLPSKWLAKLEPLAGLSQEKGGNSLRFQSNQALLLDSMLASSLQETSLRVDRKFAAIRKQLQSFQGVKPAKPPQAFQGELRQYQQEGLGWLRFLEKFGFGGCLADDMGLGKTVQVLALLAGRSRRQPKDAEKCASLVVAPNSVVHNWQKEAERFCPKLKIAMYAGTDRRKRLPDLVPYDVVLTTYGTLRKDIERLSQIAWDYAILDEAQAIKNNASQTAKASRLLKARHRLALSGTPIENHLGELWSLLEFLNPGLLGTSSAFRDLTTSGNQMDEQQIECLRKGLAPFLLRRTKAQVLPQLPKKTEQRLYCDLPASQQKQYNQLRDHYRAALNQRIAESGLAKAKIHVLEALLRLRQAACHPGLLDSDHASKPSAKLDLLMEQLGEVVSEGHKALVFSQFTQMLAIVQDRLGKANIPYEYLDGKTKDRQVRVERFQNDADCPVFLISLKAGGTGLNLTAADYVYLLDPWWNPAVESQAIDRTHRIGQTQPVFAYRLIAKHTVEEKILELQTRKNELAEAIISADRSLLKSLSTEDIQAILS
ncbi:SNF2-related protein [Bremerella sp. JC770]|uniref:DEAD/DEAH box helicase n=1 Tax=Bremerella sp. JC770 TaxID=3232137 RepID=UPI00345A024C